MRRVLVGGIGNIFLGDDGFGVAVVERLRHRPLPPEVDVVDFGIRGVDLAYALSEYEAVILVDAVRRGGAAGTLYVLEPEVSPDPAGIAMHAMTPERVLKWLSPDSAPRLVRLVGCEAVDFGPEGLGRDGLSPPVLARVDEAVGLVESLVRDLLRVGVADA
jgi:hydrogenase maturation protease